MPIDTSKVVWDDKPDLSLKSADISKVVWDDKPDASSPKSKILGRTPSEWSEFVGGNLNKGIAQGVGFLPDVATSVVNSTARTGQKAANILSDPLGKKEIPDLIPPGKTPLSSQWIEDKMKKNPGVPGVENAPPMITPAAEPKNIGEKFGAMGLQMVGAAPTAPLMGEVPKIAKIPGAIKEAVAIDPYVKQVAQKALELEPNFPLRPDMLYNNRLMRGFGDIIEQAPLSGGKGTERTLAFNKMVGEMAGMEVPKSGKITPDVVFKADKHWGSTIGRLAEETPIPSNETFRKGLEDILADAEYKSMDVERPIRKFINDLNKASVEGEIIDGKTFGQIRNRLNQQRRSASDPAVKEALSNVDDFMLEQIRTNMNPESHELFDIARQKYYNIKLIEPVVAKGTGDISPSAILNRVTSTKAGKSRMARGLYGEMGDVAEIGKHFVGEPSMNDASRKIIPLMTEGGVGALAPGTTAGALGAANVYNRSAPWLSRKMVGPPELP